MTFFKAYFFLKKNRIFNISLLHTSLRLLHIKAKSSDLMATQTCQIARRNGESPSTCISPFMLAMTICMHGGIFHIQNSSPFKNLYKQPHSGKQFVKRPPMGQFAVKVVTNGDCFFSIRSPPFFYLFLKKNTKLVFTIV